MQLKFDPFVQPDPANLFNVARPWTERQPVERMYDLLIGGKLLIERSGGMNQGKESSNGQHCRNDRKYHAFHGRCTSVEMKCRWYRETHDRLKQLTFNQAKKCVPSSTSEA